MPSEKTFEITWIIRGLTIIKAKDRQEAQFKFDLMSGDEIIDDGEPLEIEYFDEVDK